MFPIILCFNEYFPGLYGEELRIALKHVTTSSAKTLGYKKAREQLYGYIWNSEEQEAIECVYTGSMMSCAYESYDTQCNTEGKLNCEHTIPQSFFDKQDPMVSDLYHLRGSWSSVNSARQNFPFTEIPNPKKYYCDDFQVITDPSIPDDCSCEFSSSFEPRDAQKSDSAKAVAYFYTRYDSYLPTHLTQTFVKVDDMIRWSIEFPATEKQLTAYKRIQEIQGNENPYVIEEGLVERAYCDLSEGDYPCDKFI